MILLIYWRIIIKKDDAYYDVNSKSVHHYKCFLILKEVGMCSHCRNYRATLRAMKSRLQKSALSDRTSHSSHTNNYRYLGTDEL